MRRKENAAARLFSNLQPSDGCASLEEHFIPSPNSIPATIMVNRGSVRRLIEIFS